MSSEKKLTIKRLIIFLVISFVPLWIIVPSMCAYYGEQIYVSTDPSVATATYLLGVFGMMIPSAANIITRLVTKEGFRNSYLGFNTKGKMGYWTASVIVKPAETAIVALLICAVYFGGQSLSDIFPNVGMQSVGLLLLQIVSAVILFFPAFGEEWGWRGYMMPKLFELMPKPVAVLVGGVIWGLWHAPLTIAGHNFGVGYDGYPWLGILQMCVTCVFMNAFLVLVTERTKSIYPATFIHSLNNSLSFSMLFAIFGSEESLMKLGGLSDSGVFSLYIGAEAVLGAISMIFLMKGSKAKKKETLGKAA